MDNDGDSVDDVEALKGLAARTIELVLLASSLAGRMRDGAGSATLERNLSALDDAVRRGQRYVQHLAQDEVDPHAARRSTPIQRR